MEVETGAQPGGQDPYDDPPGEAVRPTGGPHIRLVESFGQFQASFIVELVNSGSVDGVHDGWCTNSHAPAPPGEGYVPVELHGSTAAVPDDLIEHPENLDLLNYLLNAYQVGDEVQVVGGPSGDVEAYTLTEFDLQDAAWALVDDVDPDWATWQPAVTQIVEEARAQGEGFRPGCGDVVVLLTVPLDNLDDTTENDVQTIALEVPFDADRCP